jgi:hypothetical protein
VQEDRLAKQLQQHLVEPIELLDGAVVLLHELLDGKVVRTVFEAELVGEGALILEQEPVLAPPGDAVQREADPPQQGLPLDQRVVFRFGQKAVPDQLMQGLGVEVAFGDPADHLDVAQAARVFLDVGLEVVGGAAVFLPACALLPGLGGEELLAVPHALGADDVAHPMA